MIEGKTPERVELADLAAETKAPWIRALLRKASRYQAYLETEIWRLTNKPEGVKEDRDTGPRVITAEELKAGQKIAVESVESIRDVFTVQSVGMSWEGYISAYKTAGSFWAITEDERIWLLEDAPAKNPVVVGDTISSDARAAELPEGTILLDHEADPWRKDKDGHWRTAGYGPDELVYCTTEPVFYTDDPLTILYLPEEETA